MEIMLVRMLGLHCLFVVRTVCLNQPVMFHLIFYEEIWNTYVCPFLVF